MKIEQLLVQHFYSHKEVTLQGLGTFTLSPDFVLPPETDKDVSMPEKAISFQFNAKATEDDDLINFIVQQTRKIKPLASADLDSYLVLGKQFLNIGKPFTIEGLGTLEKTQQGDYEFKQGQFANSKLDAAPALLKEKLEEEHISFAAQGKPSTGRKKGLIIVLCIVLLGLIAASSWYFLYYKKNKKTSTADNSEQVTAPPVMPADSTKTDSIKVDPALSKQTVALPADGYTFRVVFKETLGKEAAIIKMQDLINRKHNVIMYTKDSVYYKLAEPFKLPLTDTARIKDSLNKFYYRGKAYIERY